MELLGLTKKDLLEPSNEYLDKEFMESFPAAKQLMNMSGKMTPPSKERDLNLEPARFEGMRRRIGKQFGRMPSPGIWPKSLQTREWSLTVPCEQLPLITASVLEWYDQLKCSGEVLVLASHVKPGKKREKKLIVRIQDPSFGMATKIKLMLLSMNFEEELTLPTCLDGLTATPSEWRLKDPRGRWLRSPSGSLRT